MVALQIRDVPEELRDRLSELASQRGQSLQQYLSGELRRLADRPAGGRTEAGEGVDCRR